MVDLTWLQDWILLKVFDSQEELSEDEDESDFSYSAAIQVDGDGTRGMMRLGITVYYGAPCKQ